MISSLLNRVPVHPLHRASPTLKGIALGILIATLSSCGPATPKSPTPTPPSPPPAPTPAAPADSARRVPHEVARQLAALEARETDAANTVWAVERLADAGTSVVDGIWDALNAAPDRLHHAASLQIPGLRLPEWGPPQALPHGILEQRPAPQATGTPLDPATWPRHIDNLRQVGWKLLNTEFRHTRFDPRPDGTPGSSTFQFTAQLVQTGSGERATLQGPLRLTWQPAESPAAPPVIEAVDATSLVLRRRPGPPPFVPVLESRVNPPPRGQSIDPLLVEDLDGDGFPEILLVAANLVFRRNPAGGYDPRPLFNHAPDTVYTAVLGDFDRDGHTDILSLGFVGLQLFHGSDLGTFETPPRLVWRTGSQLPLEFPMVLTSGDIDLDGDADLYLGQYRDPYEGGSVPTPYFAATNGHPSFLLLNDGTGSFSDATDRAGLGGPRRRRIYSASFVDLDQDRDLDLVTVSDFAGIDAYRNDGHGQFTDLTASWVPEPHGFGMAHAFADFNADGHLDLLMIGMSSPTVDRLEHLGLFRGAIPGDRTHRAAMAYGNRLLLGRPGGGFRSAGPELGPSIARSGWSWGCGVGDFDNDGFPDVHIVNGLESRASVREYEAEYWRHDLFVGGAQDDPAALLYFKTKFARTRGRGMSYGGYEKNRLYLNQAGTSFLEAGHLFGVALEADSRNAVAADLDLDGRMDLVVTSFETWPEPRQVLRAFRNELPATGHWIAFHFPPDPAGRPNVGVQVEVRHAHRHATKVLVHGDSHRSQHPARLHFGLGPATDTRVEEVRITWPGGETQGLQNPGIDRVHRIARQRQ